MADYGFLRKIIHQWGYVASFSENRMEVAKHLKGIGKFLRLKCNYFVV